ncbi:MAG: hypothetical protein Q9170_003536 [Blastenia crenularia]
MSMLPPPKPGKVSLAERPKGQTVKSTRRTHVRENSFVEPSKASYRRKHKQAVRKAVLPPHPIEEDALVGIIDNCLLMAYFTDPREGKRDIEPAKFGTKTKQFMPYREGDTEYKRDVGYKVRRVLLDNRVGQPTKTGRDDVWKYLQWKKFAQKDEVYQTNSPPLSSPASSPPSIPHSEDDEKCDGDYDPKAEAAMQKEEERLAQESQRKQKKGSMKARWDAATDQKNFDKLDWFMSQSKVCALSWTSD